MSEWEPATEAEIAMREALRVNDQEQYFRILARTDILLPVAADANGGDTGWGTWTTGARTHVLAFTSPTALAECLAGHPGAYRRVPFHDLAGIWPNVEWWLAVNPGLPIEGYLPSWFVTQIGRGDVRLPGRTLGARARMEHASGSKARAVAQVPTHGINQPLPTPIERQRMKAAEGLTPDAPRRMTPPPDVAPPGAFLPTRADRPLPSRYSAEPAPPVLLPQPPPPARGRATFPGGSADAPQRSRSFFSDIEAPHDRELFGDPGSPVPAPAPMRPSVPPPTPLPTRRPGPPPAASGPAVPGHISGAQGSALPTRVPGSPPATSGSPLPARFLDAPPPAGGSPLPGRFPGAPPSAQAPLPARPTATGDPSLPTRVPGAPPAAGIPPLPARPYGAASSDAVEAEQSSSPEARDGDPRRYWPRRDPSRALGEIFTEHADAVVPEAWQPPPIPPVRHEPLPFDRPVFDRPVFGRPAFSQGNVDESGAGRSTPRDPGERPAGDAPAQEPVAGLDRIGGAGRAPGFERVPDLEQHPFFDRVDDAGDDVLDQSDDPTDRLAAWARRRLDRAGVEEPDGGFFGRHPTGAPGPGVDEPQRAGSAHSGLGWGVTGEPGSVSGESRPFDRSPAGPEASHDGAADAVGPGSSAESGLFGRGSAAAGGLSGAAVDKSDTAGPDASEREIAGREADGFGRGPDAAAAGDTAEPDLFRRDPASGSPQSQKHPASAPTPEPPPVTPFGRATVSPTPPVPPAASAPSMAAFAHADEVRWSSEVFEDGSFPSGRSPDDVPFVPGRVIDGEFVEQPPEPDADASADTLRVEPVTAVADEVGSAPSAIDFDPANQVEESLLAAATEGSTDRFLSTLLLAKVLVPEWSGDGPVEPASWRTEALVGGPHLVVFTSTELMAQRLGPDAKGGWIKFTRLIRAWPAGDVLAFAVNPDTPVGAVLPGTEVVQLASWATELGLGADDEPAPGPQATVSPAEEPTPRPAFEPPTSTGPIMMQKPISPDQLSHYLERGYDRVSGFVYRAHEVGHLRSPEQLYLALGLSYAGASFRSDATEAYVLRWLAYRGDLYRIPYGGQHEAAMRAMEGWVIERPPFRGNGFAPSETNDVIAEFKVDSARLPHNSQLWRLGRDGKEELIALLDADGPRWRRVGEL